MNFFKKIFSRKTSKNEFGYMPTIELNLEYYPTPENAPKLADIFVDTALKLEKVKLDYSVSSLKYIDDFLQHFSDEGLSVNDFAKSIFKSGCYVGEVMVKNRNGVWVDQRDVPMPPGISTMPIVIKLSDTKFCDPIAKVYKRFYFGESDSVQYFYTIFSKS